MGLRVYGSDRAVFFFFSSGKASGVHMVVEGTLSRDRPVAASHLELPAHKRRAQSRRWPWLQACRCW